MLIHFALLGVTLLGWSQWLYFRRKLDEAKVHNMIAMNALRSIYRNKAVGRCMQEFPTPPCSKETLPTELCPVCVGKRVVEMGLDEYFILIMAEQKTRGKK